jgi:hypothetical protein
VSIWLYDFLANKIDWLKQEFRKYWRKGAFRMWFHGTNYPGENGAYRSQFFDTWLLSKVFENRQKKSLKVFEFFWSWRLRTLYQERPEFIRSYCSEGRFLIFLIGGSRGLDYWIGEFHVTMHFGILIPCRREDACETH